MVGLLPLTFFTDTPIPPRSRLCLGLRPDGNRVLHHCDRCWASCRSVFYREQCPHQRLRNRAQRCDPGRCFSWIDLCSLLLSCSTVRLPPCVVADRDGRGGRTIRYCCSLWRQ